MPIHEQILRAAVALCGSRNGWRFRPVEIVRALPHLSPGTVRTHIVSRCCVNAPKNHPHKWDYFERVGRGLYEVRSTYRRSPTRATKEPTATYAARDDGPPCDTIHAIVRRSAGWFVAECLELAVVSQGRSLDELAANLQQAIELHLEDEDPSALGVIPAPRVSMTYEFPSYGV